MILYILYQSATSSHWLVADYQKSEVYLLRLKDIVLICLNYITGLAPGGQLKLYFSLIVLTPMLSSYLAVHYNNIPIKLNLFSENSCEIVILYMC